ncbi:histone-lysine N-methyltransferase PRDM9-like isoform X2 [Etheostoma cragini]|uniref:histone-lysine N-methyltransferase PRDM9-like isoform X2 n=1 Tax=Etheostoma cragini TaxID=417921 RepID=UPI00155DEEDB|nr:histone-lysine N-methyltransferase PRDM9-like isoform X2 [Etheostoma cragini]
MWPRSEQPVYSQPSPGGGSIRQTGGSLLSSAEMFKTEKLKALVHERLKAAAEDIFIIFETTIKDYEEIVFRSKQEFDQQQRRLAGWKAPLQLFVQEEDAPSEQYHCDDQEPPQIKEEQVEELWTTQAGEKQQEEVDTKDAMFNIIYVQRNDGDFPSSSCKQLKADPDEEGCGASAPTSDCQMSEVSDYEWRDSGGFPSAVNRKKQKQADETADRPYTCSMCNKNFRIKSILTRHMKTHTGEKPYRCGVCGKGFIQRSYLQTHMNSHSGQKPHTCSFCGRGFTQVGNMNAHIRIHTGEKPHICTDCGKSFREKADLIKHTIIHTGEKPYICIVCNMKFSAQSNLTRHKKTHSGDRPYSCTACGKKFIRRSHLIIHMKTHAENL